MVPLFSRRIALIQRIFVSLSPAIPGIAVFCSLVFKTSRVTGARFEQIYGCKKWYQRGPLCRCSFCMLCSEAAAATWQAPVLVCLFMFAADSCSEAAAAARQAQLQ